MTLLIPLSELLFLLSCTASIAVVGWALYAAQWSALKARSSRQHLWFGSICLLTFLYSYVQVSVENNFAFHPLLITTCTLVFGFRLSAIAGFLAVLLSHIIIGVPLFNLPFNFIVSIAMPAAVTRALLVGIAATRIQNLFLYTLGGGFGGGILAMLSCAASSLLLLLVGMDDYVTLIWDRAYVFILLLFPEGFCNGAIVSSLAVMRPELVKTYDDDFYLRENSSQK